MTSAHALGTIGIVRPDIQRRHPGVRIPQQGFGRPAAEMP
jgi:hypothetical protein